jgi:hypothetical protein
LPLFCSARYWDWRAVCYGRAVRSIALRTP